MRKFLKAWAGAALLFSLLGTQTVAHANSQVVTNTADQRFEAVGEVSTTLTAAANAELSIFLGGTYAAGNTLVLQQEVGSPGSGVFKTVLTLTSGTANARIVNRWTNGPNRNGYRLNMTATGTGEISATMTDHDIVARSLSTFFSDRETYVGPLYDDFFITGVASATVLDVNLWLTNDGTGDRGTEMVIAALEEGGGTIIGGTTDTDGACLSSTVAEWGGLPSDGWIVTEVRFRVDVITGFIWAGLADVACANDDVVNFVVTGNSVVSGGGVFADLAGIGLSDEATESDVWAPMTALADAEGANAQIMDMGTAVAATYVTLRTEIDTHGNSYHYVDGTLQHAEALAVASTVRAVAWFEVGATATVAALTAIVDYIFYVSTRPTT